MASGRDFDRAAEDILRAAQPKPDPDFVDSLERRLFPAKAPRRRPQLARRPVFAGGLLAGGLAAAAVILGLAGAGPLGSGDHSGQATSNCRFVTKREHVRAPVLVQRHGSAQIE